MSDIVMAAGGEGEVGLRRQLQDKCLQLEKEIALRKLLNAQKDEQAKKLTSAEQQLAKLASSSGSTSEGSTAGAAAAARGTEGPADEKDEKQQQLLGVLRAAEERNRELEARLHESEAEAESLRLAQLRLETANSARVAAQSAALMKRLSSMQREREKVLTTQLRVALQERQEALERAGDLVHGRDVTKLAQNTELRSLLDDMRSAKEAGELRQHGAVLVAKMKALKEDHEEKARERLRELQAEREEAKKRIRELSRDVAQLQRKLEVTETEYKLVDKTRIKALQAQLEAAVQERDHWEARSAKLEDTIETLRIVNSLQKSLKKEEDVKRSYELELQRCRAEIEAMCHTIEEMVVERNLAIVERNHAVKERNELAGKVQREFDRAEQLQRMVKVLRKKARSASLSSENT